MTYLAINHTTVTKVLTARWSSRALDGFVMDVAWRTTDSRTFDRKRDAVAHQRSINK